LDKYIVKLLPKAYRDIEQIYNYISQNFEEKEIALKLVNDIEDIKVMSINVWFHKELFNRNKINAVIRPVKLLFTDEKKKKTYWGVIFEKGVDYNGR
jgi:RNAse (barnase) inhibitor barstar